MINKASVPSSATKLTLFFSLVMQLRFLKKDACDESFSTPQAIAKLKKRVDELSVPQLGQAVSDGSLARDREELLADALIDGQDDTDGLTEESLQLKNLLLTAKGQLTDEYGFYVQRREFETQQMIDLTQLGPEVRSVGGSR